MLISTEKWGRESERRRERPSDRWDPPVRTDEKLGRNRPCFNIRIRELEIDRDID
jgi:hypothetical protein